MEKNHRRKVGIAHSIFTKSSIILGNKKNLFFVSDYLKRIFGFQARIKMDFSLKG